MEIQCEALIEIKNKFLKYVGYALKVAKGNEDIAEESIMKTYFSLYEETNYCKKDVHWLKNAILSNIRKSWKKLKRLKKIETYVSSENIEQLLVDDPTETFLLKLEAEKIAEEMDNFIKRRYPRAKDKYLKYWEIYREYRGDWEKISHYYKSNKNVNINEMKARISEIKKEFIKHMREKYKLERSS